MRNDSAEQHWYNGGERSWQKMENPAMAAGRLKELRIMITSTASGIELHVCSPRRARRW
jgi:hypothetical protein